MLSSDPYPYLSHLLNAYFHQDAFDDGDTSEDILREFKNVAQPYEVAGLCADIERFMHQISADALQRFEEAFNPDLTLARDDKQLREWMLGALSILRG